MKLLFDLFPVILFFVAFKLFNIYVATGVAIAATLAQIVYVKMRHGKVDKMLIASGIIISLLGGATLLLHDKTFIMWKPTVLYWLVSAFLFSSALVFKKNYIKELMGKQLDMPDTIWQKLNYAWGGFFIFLGFLNIYVAFNYSEDTWVNFKLFGITALMFIFIIGQGLLLSKYIKEDPHQ